MKKILKDIISFGTMKVNSISDTLDLILMFFLLIILIIALSMMGILLLPILIINDIGRLIQYLYNIWRLKNESE